MTRRDTASWQDKSWIAGIDLKGTSKAYDWNQLVHLRAIHDTLHQTPIAILVTPDNRGVFAFERKSTGQQFHFRNDTLTDGSTDYHLTGLPMDSMGTALKPLQVYQEYWHSWKTFHPATTH